MTGDKAQDKLKAYNINNSKLITTRHAADKLSATTRYL